MANIAEAEQKVGVSFDFMDFVEIGTSDFDTLIEKADSSTVGISIEPVQEYFSRLPEREKVLKINAAISNFDGESTIFFVSPDAINEFGLPKWVRGCSSINSRHETVSRILSERGIDDDRDIVIQNTIDTFRLKTVLHKHKASGVFFLKIDTEGHDTVIIRDFFSDAPQPLWPHRIVFEANLLSNKKDVQEIIVMLISIGYEMVSFGRDAEFVLNLGKSRRARVAFSHRIKGYYLADYPKDFNPRVLPYKNTLEAAQKYCVDMGYGGVTYQYGRYEVRIGDYLRRDAKNADIVSWIYY